MKRVRNARGLLLALALPGLALLAACASAGPSRRAATDAAGERVALRFAWPEGLRLSVESTYHKRNEGAAGERERSAAGAYRLVVVPQDGSLWIVVEEPRIVSMNGRPVPALGVAQSPELLGSFQVVGLFPPTLVVGPDAEIRSFDGLAGAGGLLREGPGDGLGDPRARELVRSALEARLSPEASAGAAEEVWRLSVAMWEGAELELGEAYEVVEESTTIRFSALERAPCPSPAEGRECIRLEASFTLDPDVLLEEQRAQAESLLDAAGEEPLPDAIREASDVTEVELWTEADTLLPHRVQIVDRRRAVLSDGRETGRTTERTYRYAYPKR